MLSITPVMRGSTVGVRTMLGTEIRQIVVRFPAAVRDIVSQVFRPLQVSTKPLNRWLLVIIFRGQSDWSVMLNTHYDLGLSLVIRGTVTIFLHKPSRRSQGCLY